MPFYILAENLNSGHRYLTTTVLILVSLLPLYFLVSGYRAVQVEGLLLAHIVAQVHFQPEKKGENIHFEYTLAHIK